jgi:hypothetical protein
MNPRSLLAATLLGAAALPAQMAGSYVVDPNGGPGVFHTFTEAVNAMFVSGVGGPVEFLVMPGTYTESVLVPPLQGTSPVNTVTFRSLTGPGSVLLSGSAGDTFALLAVAFLHNSSITWDGIDFMGAPGHAISATSFVEDLEIRNCNFASGHRSNATGEYRHAVIVSENSGAEAGWRIHHNHITLSSHTNRTSYGIYQSNGGDWSIHHNTFDLNSGDNGLWMINNNNRIDRVYDNLFVGQLNPVNSTYANSVCVIRADISNYQNDFTHNTFAVILPSGGCCIATGGYVSGSQSIQNYIYGNIFYTLGGTAICVTSGTTAAPFLSNGNVFFCPGGELGRIGTNVPGPTSLAGWQSLSGQDANSVETDPLLANPFSAPLDLRPLPNSPIAGVAVNTPSYVTDDYAGRLRDAQPDAGAYEATSFAYYGQGCAGTNALIPAMGSSGTVALGSTNFAFELTQAAPSTLAVLMGGLSRTASSLGALPLSIGGGCVVLASPDSLMSTISSPAGAATTPFTIPSSASLSGFDLFFQWAILDAASGSPYGITTSDAGALQF